MLENIVSFNFTDDFAKKVKEPKSWKKLIKNCKLSNTCTINNVYSNIQRCQLLEGKYGDEIDDWCEIYSSSALKISKLANNDISLSDFCTQDLDVSTKLPTDENIFVDGIPFHHLKLSKLNENYIRLLLKNGIEISKKHFSQQEDDQIMRNWVEFAEKYGILPEEGMTFMSAAVCKENRSDHNDRLKFIQMTNFRPWMCKRLLNRTCAQVFRRCYFLFRNDSEWTSEDDAKLMFLCQPENRSWEEIGFKMGKTRYACNKRYLHILKSSNPSQHTEKWSNTEISRLYVYLSRKLDVHPVLVATVSDYNHYDNNIRWGTKKMKLPSKSAEQRKTKWNEIKLKFLKYKNELKTDIICDVEKKVFPNSRLISAVGTTNKKLCRMEVSPAQLIKCINLLTANDKLLSFKDIDMVEFSKNIAHIISVPFEVDNSADRIMRRLKYIMQICKAYKFFHILPIDQDTLHQRFQLIKMILRKENSFKIHKRKVRKHIRRYVRAKSWIPRKRFVFVDKEA